MFIDDSTDLLAALIIAVFVGVGLILMAWIDSLIKGGWSANRLFRRLRALFGVAPKTLPVVTRQFPMSDLPNIQRALDRLAAEPGISHSVVGYDGYTLRQIGQGAASWGTVQPKESALRYLDVDIDVDEQMQCMENGLRLFNTTDGPFAIFVAATHAANSGSISLEVMALTPQAAAKVINRVREDAAKLSVYRGKVVSFEERHVDDGPGFVNVRFHQLPAVADDEIILPPETLSLVKRNSVHFFEHADILRRSGRSLKRGLLLHGVPGTGKTLTAKWLSTSLKDVTVILLSGEQLWHVKECCQLARALAPALVIMEDVDLIAEERQASSHHTALHQLLNEMDGLDSDAEVIFLLTTNRPEVIEPALANRPGRIDQAIHFPLPNAECRHRLFALYGKGLNLANVNVERFVKRTDGASPAFIKELIRKSALNAAENACNGDDCLSLADAHFDEALRELTIGGGELSRQLLGFHIASEN